MNAVAPAQLRGDVENGQLARKLPLQPSPRRRVSPKEVSLLLSRQDQTSNCDAAYEAYRGRALNPPNPPKPQFPPLFCPQTNPPSRPPPPLPIASVSLSRCFCQKLRPRWALP